MKFVTFLQLHDVQTTFLGHKIWNAHGLKLYIIEKTEVFNFCFAIFVEMTKISEFPKFPRKFCCLSLLDVGFLVASYVFVGGTLGSFNALLM